MAQLIRVPELGIAIANVTIVQWLVKEGEKVEKGQPLLEVLTDKMTMEVPAETSGRLLRVLFEEEAELTIGVPIAIIGENGEAIDDLLARARAELEGTALAESVKARAGTLEPAAAPAAAAPPRPSKKVRASPLARRLAREKGIDLAAITPRHGSSRISKADVLRYEAEMTAASAALAPVGEEPEQQAEAEREGTPPKAGDAGDAGAAHEVIPLKGTRKVIAENMIRSVRTSAHYTMGIDVDCEALVALRRRLREELKRTYDVDLTYVPFVVKAIAAAVGDVPIVNATLRDDKIIIPQVAHVGVAVASDDYIYVPVIKESAHKSLLQVTKELAEYVRLVGVNQLTPAHTQGGTITLTNMGVTEATIHAGLTIINQPQVAIVTMGRIKDTVVPVAGEAVIRPIMDMTFTYDHRVVMGVPGGRFAERVKYYLEKPEVLLAG